MATTATRYKLDGSILEACSCAGPCPCWVGDDPDGGTCDSFNAYHIDRGQITGVDVSGLTIAKAVHIPGNVLAGNWREVLYVDERATDAQREALLSAFTGKLGGPLADIAALTGERVGVYSASIDYRIEDGQGTLVVGDKISATMEPYRDLNGRPTTLHDSIFSTIPGSPAYVAKAHHHTVNIPEHQMIWEFSGRNAIQGSFHFEV